MFYNLTDQQLRTIKANLYPKETSIGDFLKAVVINTYGTDNPDTSLRVVLSIKDGVQYDLNGKQLFHVFGSDDRKKYLKMKLFEVQSAKMLADLQNFSTIEDIEAVINNYGAQYRDFQPSFDFLGNKTNLDGHIRLDKPEGAIELVYDTTFLLPRESIDFLSLGLIFYFDKQQYLEDQNIDKRFIDERILIDNLMIYHLYNGGQVVSTTVRVQDLRFASTIFKGQKVLDKLEEINLAKALKSRLSKSGKKYFSNCYLSRNHNNTAGISFTIDYESILKDNSIYSELFERSGLKEDLIAKSKITDIKVKRRMAKKYGQNKIIYTLNSETVIIGSAEDKNSSVIQEKQDENGYLSEININASTNKHFRTFVANDKKVFVDSTGLHQYGAEITVSDGINQFLKDYADSLGIHITRLREYIEETNKIAKVSEDGTYNFAIRGSYDALRNAFTPEFLRNFALPRGSGPSFKDITVDAAASFIATLSLLGLERENNDNLKRSVALMLHPLSTNAETLIYFVSLFETVISEIYKLIKDNFNSTYTIQTWFENDFLDASASIKTGYKYFDEASYRGLPLIRSIDYTNRVTSEVNRFSVNPNIDYDTAGSKVLAYLTPNFVFSNNFVLPLLNLTAEADSVTNYDFMLTERDIKTDILGNLSTKVDSRINYFEELLSLALAKQYNPVIKTYNKQVTNTTSIIPTTKLNNFTSKDTIKQTELPFSPSTPTAPVVQQQIEESDQVPHQLNALLDDKCRLLQESDNYRKSIEHLSKYNLLFNTIQAIEVLTYKNNTLDEEWELITIDRLQKLLTENLVLCRLREYTNSAFGIAGMKEIRLPVYNKYFLLSSSIFSFAPTPRYVDLITKITDIIKEDVEITYNNMFDNITVSTVRDQLDLGDTQAEIPVIEAPIFSQTDITAPIPEPVFRENIQTFIEPALTIPTLSVPTVTKTLEVSQPVFLAPINLAAPFKRIK